MGDSYIRTYKYDLDGWMNSSTLSKKVFCITKCVKKKPNRRAAAIAKLRSTVPHVYGLASYQPLSSAQKQMLESFEAFRESLAICHISRPGEAFLLSFSA